MTLQRRLKSELRAVRTELRMVSRRVRQTVRNNQNKIIELKRRESELVDAIRSMTSSGK